jgi:hypothetical protein
MRVGNVVSSSNDHGIQFVEELIYGRLQVCSFATEKFVVNHTHSF